MAYGELIESLREGLAVTAEHDRSILREIKKAARTLLMIYDFREAVQWITPTIAAGEWGVDLPADAGRIKGVRLSTVENGTTLFKVLKRRGETQLPVYEGPSFYMPQGSYLYLDQMLPLGSVGYYLDIFYQSVDPDVNESWLSTTYEGPLEHLAGSKLALMKRKTEAAQIYNALWQQDTVILARYVAENQFSDMDMGMGETSAVSMERYPA